MEGECECSSTVWQDEESGSGPAQAESVEKRIQKRQGKAEEQGKEKAKGKSKHREQSKDAVPPASPTAEHPRRHRAEKERERDKPNLRALIKKALSDKGKEIALTVATTEPGSDLAPKPSPNVQAP
jgi:hypothetical protein